MIRVPGKLMLAGEYAVLAGGPALACAVSRHLTCEAGAAGRFAIEGNGLRWEEGEPDVAGLAFARAALRVTRDYLKAKGRECPPVSLVLRDELRAADGTKLGLGGSACSTIAVVASVLCAAGSPLEKPLIFKLAAVAHGAAQSRQGSAVDIAASTFGGTIWTWRFDASPLVALWRGASRSLAAAIDEAELPALEKIPNPPGILLAFSGSSASTPDLIGAIERFAAKEPRLFAEFVARTSNACDRLRKALERSSETEISGAIQLAGRQLEILGDQSGTPIVTESIRSIIAEAARVNVSAKVSGAGGGDSCIALSSPDSLAQLAKDLTAHGVLAQSLEIDCDGVTSV